MRIARVTIKSNMGRRYKSFDITFNGKKHFDNWYDKVSTYSKVIGIMFADGKDSTAFDN